MGTTAVWVHGNAVRVQFPGAATAFSSGHFARVDGVDWTEEFGYPTGPGARYRGLANTDNWFHFSLPSPVLLNDARATLERVFVLFRSDEPVSVTQVAVFDGQASIEWFPAASNGVSGTHDGSGGPGDLLDSITRWNLSSPHVMLWGVGISVHVVFNREGEISFAAAGADFSI